MLTDHITHTAALEQRIQRLREALRRQARTAEMSAGIMRDRRRTGAWAGAERTANAFDRLACAARAALEADDHE